MLTCIVDQRWSDLINIPKMRNLRHIFANLYLYKNNVFFDGKMVEYSHQFGKFIQKFHNNFHGFPKEWVTKNCLRWFALLYVMNGGRWGTNMNNRLGQSARNLTHPVHRGKPHPLIDRFLIGRLRQQNNIIEVTKLFAPIAHNQQWWNNVLNDNSSQQLQSLLQAKYNMPNLSLLSMQRSNRWTIRRIKSFRFHNHNKSFAITFNRESGYRKPRCIVKTHQQLIIRFDIALVIECDGHDPAWVCKAECWKIQRSNNPNQWLDDYFSSMDFINDNHKRFAWCHLTNISEPVFLIHNCVNFAAVSAGYRHMPTQINKYDYIQNMHYWSQRMIKYQRNCHVPYPVELPCGPHYICKQHNVMVCQQCETRNFRYSQKNWIRKWICNTAKDPKFWVFDSNNGLVMTMIRQTHKQDDNLR